MSENTLIIMLIILIFTIMGLTWFGIFRQIYNDHILTHPIPKFPSINDNEY